MAVDVSQISAPEAPSEPSPTPILDGYINAMRERSAPRQSEPQPSGSAPADTPAAAEEAPGTQPTEAKVEAPRPKPQFSEILKDPDYQRSLQSEIDRRAAAEAARRQRADQARIAEQERVRAEQELRKLVATATKNDPYDPEVQEAREQLALITNQRMQADSTRAEAERMAQDLAVEREQQARMAVINHLDAAYSRLYTEVPELNGKLNVHHTNFEDPTEWGKTMIDEVRKEARAAAEADFNSRVAQEIEKRLPQELARLRATLPNPDVIATTGSGGPSHYTTSASVEAAFVNGSLQVPSDFPGGASDYVRWARRALPYQ